MTTEQTAAVERTSRHLLKAWLDDALAMENALAVVLQHRIKDSKDFPEVQKLDREHLQETLQHAEMVKRAITRLGEKPSTAKSMFGTVFGTLQAPMTGLAKDEVVKNFLVDHAAEQFEVASYRALIVAAREVGETETAEACEKIMAEDQAMADRLMELLPIVVKAHMGTLSAVPAGTASSGEMMGQPAEEKKPAVTSQAQGEGA
ncbi:MAG TPA: DUF892 family protein [Thermomicrobiales bacterium]|jgi:ferritin-like metal-binding protein YciE|nr:DUF892 family protein [Thermomicrobiales bacterium]